MSTGTPATDPELDEALTRAVRQLIAEAMEAGQGAETDTDDGTGNRADTKTGPATGSTAKPDEAGSAAA